MCGITAIFGQPSKNLLTMFEIMLELNVERGKDSTGIYASNIRNKNKDVLIKDVVLPIELIKSKEYREAIDIKPNDYSCYIGHCRAATKGTITRNNAHPFVINNTVMVHNGTLFSNVKNKENVSFETDSESVAYSIAHTGIRHTWKEVDGAASLIFWDRERQTLSMITNGKRPLHFAYANDYSTVFISSLAAPIERAAKAMGVLLRKETVYYPKDDMLFSFFKNKDTGKINSKSEELEPYKFIPTYVYKRTTTSIGEHSNPLLVGGENTSNKNNVINFNFKKNISESKFKKRYKRCIFCFTELEHDYEKATIIDDSSAACGDCTQMANTSGWPLTGNFKGI